MDPEEESQSSMAEELDTDNSDYDALLDEIDNCDDLDLLDDMMGKFETLCQNKSEQLKKIREENEQMKRELEQNKHLLSELNNVQEEEEQKNTNLQELIDAARQELSHLKLAQVEDLKKFEEDARTQFKMFMNARKQYDQVTLAAEVEKLENELKDKRKQLTENQKELQEVKNQTVDTFFDTKNMTCSIDTFEECVNACDIEIKTLTKSIETMKVEATRLGSSSY